MTEPPGSAQPGDPERAKAESRTEHLARAARRGTERAKIVSADLVARSEVAREHYRSVDLAFEAHERDRRLAGGLLAGALAFRIFLLMLPLVLVFVAGFGLYSEADSASAEAASHSMGLTSYAANIVDQASAESHTGKVVALLLGLIGILFASRSAFRALRVIHALVWRLPIPKPKVGWKPVLVLAATAASLWFFVAGAGALGSSGPLGFVAALLMRTALYAGLVVWLNATMPHPPETGFRDYLPGAIVASIGMQAIQVFSELYLIRKAQSFSDLYGGLGVAAVLLLWLFLLGRLIVGAVMLNATRWGRRQSEETVEVAAD